MDTLDNIKRPLFREHFVSWINIAAVVGLGGILAFYKNFPPEFILPSFFVLTPAAACLIVALSAYASLCNYCGALEKKNITVSENHSKLQSDHNKLKMCLVGAINQYNKNPKVKADKLIAGLQLSLTMKHLP